jgi:hypothetical protein
VVLAGYWWCKVSQGAGVEGSYAVAEGAKILRTPHHSQDDAEIQDGRSNASRQRIKPVLIVASESLGCDSLTPKHNSVIFKLCSRSSSPHCYSWLARPLRRKRRPRS